jgi:putative colanic acid biosynthesis acetyltransferase WcaF
MSFSLLSKPIILEENSWVGASSFIGMGVTVGEGAVVGATSSVYKDVERWTVVGGNPAKFIKKRIIYD